MRRNAPGHVIYACDATPRTFASIEWAQSFFATFTARDSHNDKTVNHQAIGTDIPAHNALYRSVQKSSHSLATPLRDDANEMTAHELFGAMKIKSVQFKCTDIKNREIKFTPDSCRTVHGKG